MSLFQNLGTDTGNPLLFDCTIFSAFRSQMMKLLYMYSIGPPGGGPALLGYLMST